MFAGFLAFMDAVKMSTIFVMFNKDHHQGKLKYFIQLESNN